LLAAIEPLSQRFAGINLDNIPPDRDLPIENIAVPTLIVTAEDDLFNTLPTARHAAAKIPGAKLVVYPSGGHLLAGRHDALLAEVRRFLATVK
jgi:2-hydroxy-6-oxonona-2,4-dienedioate hydrolase